ncbi:small secreted protein [Laccaria bicolor S238N-H82]|uniref:Small secreted protein n=1 Tax=Laccaria bicolor (strain S238N-H82 / ATCC MYA-4686) TaxID=486041 RepID=B0D2U2_LACBS|nr:small secreted protein [Laccaria bicolor S238N-H82]EDR10811.1 small secreted protein [Laccaria bicolor S238N-H82]|eukprot:XP_001878112.1 small secreted protein [Laccaria bicolor S238N-H82]
MKTLFFIALIAVVAHATPTIRNDRIESFQASDSLDGLAHRRETAFCENCDLGSPKPYCRPCPSTWFGGCVNTHTQTCNYDGAETSDNSCGAGSWGCVAKCCPGTGKKCN